MVIARECVRTLSESGYATASTGGELGEAFPDLDIRGSNFGRRVVIDAGGRRNCLVDE